MNKMTDILGLDTEKVRPVADELQKLLADFQIHYANLRGYHWNIKGKPFFTLHEKFEELYDQAATVIDDIAERLLQLGYTPANKYSDYLKAAEVQEVDGVRCGNDALNTILHNYKILIKREREIVSLADDASDETTASLISDVLKAQEKTAWMLSAYVDIECE